MQTADPAWVQNEALAGVGGGGGMGYGACLNFKPSRVGVYKCFMSLSEIKQKFFVFVQILQKVGSLHCKETITVCNFLVNISRIKHLYIRRHSRICSYFPHSCIVIYSRWTTCVVIELLLCLLSCCLVTELIVFSELCTQNTQSMIVHSTFLQHKLNYKEGH